MNVIAIWGGLGNQMFQYAFGQFLRLHAGEDVRYDASTYFCRKRRRRYELGEFACDPKMIDGYEARRLYAPGFLNRLFGGRPRLSYCEEEQLAHCAIERLATLRNVYLKGYFQYLQCCEAMRDQLSSDFRLRNPPEEFRRRARMLSACESVAVHVRRGDYVALGMTECCPVAYYDRAAQLVLEKVPGARFFVFSDDLAWARENLGHLPQVEFVSPLDVMRPALDLMLMKACRHNIIANSSFSWWSAFLNGNSTKVVVAPEKWTATEDSLARCPKEWVRT